MDNILFITHADIVMDRDIPVPEWSLSKYGRERHERFNQRDCVNSVTSVYCSDEKKAKDGADILANHLEVKYHTVHDLHENDRSATGFLEPEEFQRVADQFFAHPSLSIRGWEKAEDAQLRIVNSVKNIVERDQSGGNIAIVSHGGVGALLLCHLLKSPISRELDQPANGGGNYFCFTRDWQLLHRWLPIDGPI